MGHKQLPSSNTARPSLAGLTVRAWALLVFVCGVGIGLGFGLAIGLRPMMQAGGQAAAPSGPSVDLRSRQESVGNDPVVRLGSGLVTGMVYSPDGERLAVSTSISVNVYDATTLRLLWSAPTDHKQLSVAWSPDGSELASGTDVGTINVWNAATGVLTNQFATRQTPPSADPRDEFGNTPYGVQSIGWTPDGARLVTVIGTSNVATMLDSSTGEILFESHDQYIAAWSVDGTRLAGGQKSGETVVWDTATGDTVLSLEGGNREVTSLSWSPNGERLAVGSGNSELRVWDVQAGERLYSIVANLADVQMQESVSRLGWSPDGARLMVELAYGGIMILDAITGEVRQETFNQAASWSPDGARFASSAVEGGTITIWDTTGQPLQTLTGYPGAVWYWLVWSPDGTRLISYSDDGIVEVWDMATGQPIHLPSEDTKNHLTSLVSPDVIPGMAWSPDGMRLATTTPEHILIWDTATTQIVQTLDVPLSFSVILAWSPDSTRLASGYDDFNEGQVVVWDVTTGQPVNTLGRVEEATSIAWSPDGRRLAAAGRTIPVWDVASGETLMTSDMRGTSLAWSSDGSRLAALSYVNVFIWNAATGEQTLILSQDSYALSSIAWSLDGTRMVGASHEGIIVEWDTTTGDLIYRVETPAGDEWNLVLSPDGTRLATVSEDNTVIVLDTATGDIKTTFSGHNDLIMSLAWSSDGRKLASASDDKTILIWLVE